MRLVYRFIKLNKVLSKPSVSLQSPRLKGASSTLQKETFCTKSQTAQQLFFSFLLQTNPCNVISGRLRVYGFMHRYLGTLYV